MLKRISDPFLRTFERLNQQEKLRLVWLTGLRILISGLDILAIIGVGLIASISASTMDRSQSESHFAFFTWPMEPELLVFLVPLVFGGFIAKSLLSIVLVRRTALALANVETRIAQNTAELFFRQSRNRIDATTAPELQWAVGQSLTVAFSAVPFSAITLVTETAVVIAILATMLVIEPWLGLGVVVFLTASVIIFQKFIRGPLHEAGSVAAETNVEFSNRIFDLRSLFFEARTFGTVDEFLERFGKAREANSNARATQKAIMVLPRFVLEILLFAALLAFTLYLTITGSIVDRFALLGFALAAGLKITAALVPIQTAIAELRAFLPMAERTHQMIENLRPIESLQVAHTQKGHPAPLVGDDERDGPLSVSLKSVSFKFDEDLVPAIKDVSLEIGQGEFVAFVGPTGAGKTTLANLILGLERVTRGEIRLSGTDPTDENLQRLGRLAYVPQNPGLLNGSWKENVFLYRKPQELRQSLEEVSGILAIDDWSWVDLQSEQIKSMSGGQKQLLALLRATINSPGLLVLDEFSSAMDPLLEAQIMESLQMIRNTATVIVIAHRLATIKNADTVYFIDHGEVRTKGSFNELSASDEMFKDFLRASGIS